MCSSHSFDTVKYPFRGPVITDKHKQQYFIDPVYIVIVIVDDYDTDGSYEFRERQIDSADESHDLFSNTFPKPDPLDIHSRIGVGYILYDTTRIWGLTDIIPG